MGVVHKAEDLKLSRRVAFNFLPDGLSRSLQALGRFKQEAHAAIPHSAFRTPHSALRIPHSPLPIPYTCPASNSPIRGSPTRAVQRGGLAFSG
jgi:hypothetical protein